MEQTKKITVAYFFLTFGMIVTLITSISSFLVLVFETLNNAFPDALNATYEYGYNAYQYDAMRSATAILIIFFPVFLIVNHFWIKKTTTLSSGNNLILRKWALYIIAFLVAVMLAIDLVTLINFFISGETTTRFILKVVAVILSGSIIGAYVLHELKRDYTKKLKGVIVYMSVGILLMLSAIIYSFTIMGSPAKQRSYRFDDRRTSDLRSIQDQVTYYWQQKEKLPQKLADLSNPFTYYALPIDPEFEKGKTYEYRIISEMSFELCATFSLPLPKGWVSSGGAVEPMPARDVTSSYPSYGNSMNVSWEHSEGRTCFTRTIDKDMYPPFSQSVTK